MTRQFQPNGVEEHGAAVTSTLLRIRHPGDDARTHRDCRKSTLVCVTSPAYQGDNTTPDQHTVAVPTQRSTLPTGRLQTGILPGQQLETLQLGSPIRVFERHRSFGSGAAHLCAVSSG